MSQFLRIVKAALHTGGNIQSAGVPAKEYYLMTYIMATLKAQQMGGKATAIKLKKEARERIVRRYFIGI